MTAADVLNKAADLLERHGWCQGVSIDAAGRMCAGYALQQAEPDVHARYGARIALFEIIGVDSVNILAWNDRPKRTAEQVIATFRAAAERAS